MVSGRGQCKLDMLEGAGGREDRVCGMRLCLHVRVLAGAGGRARVGGRGCVCMCARGVCVCVREGAERQPPPPPPPKIRREGKRVRGREAPARPSHWLSHWTSHWTSHWMSHWPYFHHGLR